MATEIERVELNDKIEYRLNGKLHRENGPAIIWANGDKEWYINGKLHRKDGPAIESVNGDKKWYMNDKLHRGIVIVQKHDLVQGGTLGPGTCLGDDRGFPVISTGLSRHEERATRQGRLPVRLGSRSLTI